MTIILSLVYGFTNNIIAQEKTHEVGLRFSGLTYFNGVYKKQLKPNKFFRITLGNINLGSRNLSGTHVGFLGAKLTFGFEKHKPLNNKLSFIHGLQPQFSYNQSLRYSPKSSIIKVSAGLFYIFGLQYEFNNNFFVSLDIAPGVLSRASYFNGVFESQDYFIDADISNVFLGLTYRFTK